MPQQLAIYILVAAVVMCVITMIRSYLYIKLVETNLKYYRSLAFIEAQHAGEWFLAYNDVKPKRDQKGRFTK